MYRRVFVYTELVLGPEWLWLPTKFPSTPPASQDSVCGHLWPKPTPGYVTGKALVALIWSWLGPCTSRCCPCGEGPDLILQAEMNYFSLMSKAVPHASFLRVMGSIFSLAVDRGWGNIPALRATTGGGKHLPGILLPGVLLLLLLSVSCCNRSYIYWLLMLRVGIRLLLMDWKTWMHW